MPASTTATPAPLDSKEGSLALFSVDEEKEAKDLRDLEQEEKKEIILSEAFDLSVKRFRVSASALPNVPLTVPLALPMFLFVRHPRPRLA